MGKCFGSVGTSAHTKKNSALVVVRVLVLKTENGAAVAPIALVANVLSGKKKRQNSMGNGATTVRGTRRRMALTIVPSGRQSSAPLASS